MTTRIDPARLRQLRDDQNLSQAELAKKAKINKQTIYRLENGTTPSRKLTIDRLSKALSVEIGVLTGEISIPPQGKTADRIRDDAKYQLKLRFDGKVRNAFSLAERRYNVPIAVIVELAPLLFVIVAERSLKKRREKLEELENALRDVDRLASDFPHLRADTVTASQPFLRIIEAERASIYARDVFTENMPGDVCSDWEPNPIAELVKELAASCVGATRVDDISPYHANYTVCPDEALAIADGDEKIAEEILSGGILIHQMPRHLMDRSKTKERTTWLRTQAEFLEENRRSNPVEYSENPFSELVQEEGDETQS